MSRYGHRDKCAIVGIGSTPFTKSSGVSVNQLVAQASLAAIADAGLSPIDIDGVVRSDYDTVQQNDIVHTLGLRDVSFWGMTGIGGAAPCGMIGLAVGAILSGQAENILVYRGLNGRSGLRYGRGTSVQGADPRAVGGDGSLDEFFLPYGLVSPGQMFSLIAQRHFIEYGTTSEQLGALASTVRNRANANPYAMMSDRAMTVADHQASPMLSSPLRLFDYCLESDGACAVVVTSAERAIDSPHTPALIRAVAQGSVPDPQRGKVFASLMRSSVTTQSSENIAQRLYSRAGLGPADIDVAQLYDCFTITLLIGIEDYGFCPKGEGGAFIADGEVDMAGTIPVNTAGGNLSEAYIHGMNHVVEGVRQIRGTSTSQVIGAQTCLVSSGLPPMSSALILQAA